MRMETISSEPETDEFLSDHSGWFGDEAAVGDAWRSFCTSASFTLFINVWASIGRGMEEQIGRADPQRLHARKAEREKLSGRRAAVIIITSAEEGKRLHAWRLPKLSEMQDTRVNEKRRDEEPGVLDQEVSQLRRHGASGATQAEQTNPCGMGWEAARFGRNGSGSG